MLPYIPVKYNIMQHDAEQCNAVYCNAALLQNVHEDISMMWNSKGEQNLELLDYCFVGIPIDKSPFCDGI